MAFKWYEQETSYTLTQYGASGAALCAERSEPGLYNRYHALLPDCRRVEVCLDAIAALCEAAWYTADEPLPEDVQRWEVHGGCVDLLTLMVRPGEEFTELGGLLPLYAGEHGIKTAVAFLSCDKRSLAEEAMCALWRIGVTDYPIFLNLPMRNVDAEKIVSDDWARNGRLISALEELFHRLQPLTVVFGGAGDHATAAGSYAAALLVNAAQTTYDGALEDDEVARQVQKIYVQDAATGGEPATVLDWMRPLYMHSGVSAYVQAKLGYARYETQSIYRITVPETSDFVLLHSLVGEDEAKDDLFEHIETDALLFYAEPTPTPAPTSTPTPIPEKTSALLHTPEAEGGAAISDGPPGELPAIVAGSGLLASIALLPFIKKRIKTGRGSTALWWLCLVPLNLALLIAAGLWRTGQRQTVAATIVTPALIAVPTPMLEPTNTLEPTVTPKPIGTPAPRWAEYFLQESDPVEVILADAENGRWSYRSDTLSIEIERRTEQDERKIVTYFVAHIRMRSMNDFRPAFGSDGRTGHGAMAPWIIARRARAVLFVSGDNMINMEKEMKGIILRDGRVFGDCRGEDTIAFMPDMSLRIYSPDETTAQALLEAGVENTFSFGPTLIRNGVVNESARKHRTWPRNPRMGMGMVESGHLVVIAVDGRDRKYSVGVTLQEFADMFAAEGCVEAYNLDGGASVAILFMGEQINYHANYPGDMQRPVPDGLVWGYSGQVPTEFDPIGNKGQH